jgi:hypothetical protein
MTSAIERTTDSGPASAAQDSEGKAAASLYLMAIHDLRQHVQALEFLAGTVRDADHVELRERLARMIGDTAASLRFMVEGIRLVAGIETGERSAKLEPLSGKEAVRGALDGLGARAGPVQVGTLRGEGWGDRALLGEVLKGGIGLALAYGSPGSVRVDTATKDGRLRITISFAGDLPEAGDAGPSFIDLAACSDQPAITLLAPAMARRLMVAMGGSLLLDTQTDDRVGIVLELPA